MALIKKIYFSTEEFFLSEDTEKALRLALSRPFG